MNLPALFMPESLNPSVSKKYLLRYPHEYQRTMKVTGRKEWITLKKKLSCPDAETVVTALNLYICAILAARMALQTFKVFYFKSFPATCDMAILKERWDTIARLRRACVDANRAQVKTRYDLMVLLVGKEHLCAEPSYDQCELE